MRYLILCLFLVGCCDNKTDVFGNSDSAESLNIRIGQEVTIKSGFYKGCTGIAVSYDDYRAIDDTVTLGNVVCQNATISTLTLKAKEVR